MYVRTSDGLGQAGPTGSTRQANRGSPDYIRWVQRSLNSLLGLNLKVDGIMGPQTRSAIRSFQQKQGLVADGVVGANTEAALIKATSGTAPAPVITPPTTDIIKSAAARLKHFDKNSAKLKDFHAPDIDRVADMVVASWKTGQPIFTIYVKGHSSSEGPAQYNIGLGNHRALAVRKALQKALEKKQKNLSYKVLILTLSKGAKEPINTNETEEGKSQNRRVEIFLSTKALKPLPKPKPPDIIFEEDTIKHRLPAETKPPEHSPECKWDLFFEKKALCRKQYSDCKWACLYRELEKHGPAALACLPILYVSGGKALAACLAALGIKIAPEIWQKCADECDPGYVRCIREAKEKTNCAL